MPRKPAPAPVPVLTGPIPSHRIRLNLTGPEREALRVRAAQEGISMATLSRRLVTDYLKDSSDNKVDSVVRRR
jgi:plasmid stability protein